MRLNETQGVAQARRTVANRQYWLPGWVSATALDVPMLVAFGLLIVLPLVTVLAQAVMPAVFNPIAPGSIFDLSPLRRTFLAPRVRRSILQSVEPGALVAVTIALVGGRFAALIQRFILPLRWLLAPVPWLLFVTHAYLMAMA